MTLVGQTNQITFPIIISYILTKLKEICGIKLLLNTFLVVIGLAHSFTWK